MGRGGARYLSYTALVLLSAVSTVSAGLWDVSIDLSPAPSPEDGPPFSFYATRDRSLLPYQIVGVVGAYIACVLILGSLLLTVGRRARKRAQDMANRPIELVNTTNKNFEIQSPEEGMSGWLRKVKSRTGSMRSGRSNIGSPGGASVLSFDTHTQVVEQDRRRNDEDMARLYGAVYGDEDRKNVSFTEMQSTMPPRYDRGQLPPLAMERHDLQRVQTSDSYPQSPMSPMTPKSPPFKAIYPPEVEEQRRTDYPTTPRSPVGLPKSPRDGRTASFGSTRNPNLPSPQKVKKGIKNLRITRPLGYDKDNEDGARTPLSPRAFETDDVAPAPPTGWTNDSQHPPTTPGTGRSIPYPEDRDVVRDLPQAYPQRGSYYQYDNPAQALTDAASQRPDPTGTIPQNKRGNVPAASIGKPLALREFASQQRLAHTEQAFPSSPIGSWNNGGLKSPTPYSPGLQSPHIRENVIEFKKHHLGVPPMTGQLTGAPTPYSPYMPREIVTPVFSPLTTRHERKQREKERKAMRGAATDRDQVADEKDLWSSGY
ncbi:hypothetical protein DOTSEDRAFT_23776 [Dothistroma septosporum NZE10]|uniref:Uncharacterized protein n=1 Tax=Dothistroma septosporum (strain NZE10 / CBS 128990) TaxID=675120 RepID=N1PQS0_DOTSN|nr:hypothetical protein DOTSEDRAFT_23776 [Dothistroma septosporum NZE10]